MKRTINNISLGGLYIMLGIVLPLITHSMGAGNIILPMHIPVLLAGLTLRPGYAAIVGLATPLLSTLLSGMPVAIPMLPIMATELAVYALCASFLRLRGMNVWISLICSMVVGRIFATLAVLVLSNAFFVQIAPPITYIVGAITTGLPGIAIQIVLVPPIFMIVDRLQKKGMLETERKYFDEKSQKWDSIFSYDLDKIATMLGVIDIKGKSVVDIGAGTGVLLKKFIEKGASRVVAMDISPAMIEIAKEKHKGEDISYVVGDIMAANLGEKADVFVAYSVWPHIFDKGAFLRNVRRQMTSGGQLFIAHTSTRAIVNKRAQSKNSLPPVAKLEKQAKRYGYRTIDSLDSDIYYILLERT